MKKILLCLLVYSFGSSSWAQVLPEIPDDMTPFLGDPERGPEPQARHAATRVYPELDPIELSSGHPLRDFGHFRMSERITHARRSPAVLSIPREEMSASADRWERHAFEDGKHLHYSLARPPETAPVPEHGFPLVVLQPGIGGIGQTSTGANLWLTDTYRQHFPAYVVYLHPQSRTHEYITREDGINNGRPTAMIDHYIAGIEHLLETHPDIDRHRIYLHGHSMGGSSTWYIMLARPDLVAAAVPLAGIPPIDLDEAERLKNIPIWMMMGNNDPWSGSYPYIRTYQNLVKAGAQRVRFWEIQDIGHSSRPANLWPIAEFLFSFRQGEDSAEKGNNTPTAP